MNKNDVRRTPERVSFIGSCMILVLCVFYGCSSDDSSQRYGTFVDSAVEGVAYKTATLSGLTGIYGRFHFEPGETVTFSIGGIVLGTATAKSVITPLDLVEGATDELDPAVTNITRVLITLDEDNDPVNGITISAQMSAALADISVDFNQDTASFDQDPELLEVMSVVNGLYGASGSPERTICSAQDAQEHLRNTLDELAKDDLTKKEDESPDSSGGNIRFGGGGDGGGCGG